jgi:uncharacterized cofD-like protein
VKSPVKILYFGMHLKRWLALLLIGVALMSLGIAYLLVQMYRVEPFPWYVSYLTLQFVERPVRAVVFLLAGSVSLGIALIRLNRTFLAPFLPSDQDNILELIHQHHRRRRSPKVVAIGGGTGLSTLLRGLKDHTANLTAIVTVADDGGSSGRLRKELGILPPGDFRQCLIALADAEPMMKKLFQFRFTEAGGLEGHSFGNLFIAAMTATTGNFERALRESSRVLAVRGQILPSTFDDLTLCAEFEDDATVLGESAIPKQNKRVRRVFLQPRHPSACPEAIRAILAADLIVIGPGSLFTSVLPNLLVQGITRAIRSSRAVKVYVCNVATDPGETDGFRIADHVRAFESHVGPGLFQYILVNSQMATDGPFSERAHFMSPRDDALGNSYLVVPADVIDPIDPRRHDSRKLSRSLMQLYNNKRNQVHSAYRDVFDDDEAEVLTGTTS